MSGSRTAIISIDDSNDYEEADDSVIFISEGTPSKFGLTKKNVTNREISESNFCKILTVDPKETEGAYYCEELKTFVDLKENGEWSEVKLDTSVQSIFDKLKENLFDTYLKQDKYVVNYDVSNVICDGSSFQVFEDLILLDKATVVRPRIELISLLLHILIHAYLNKVSKGNIKMSHHDVNFRQFMQFFNKLLCTKISASHKFNYTSEQEKFKTQWWQCTGICSNYEPFRGIIRSACVPNEALSFWSQHHGKCGGSFFKIFEFERENGHGDIEKKYLRNVKYMIPAASNQMRHQHLKNSLPVREQIDLTCDTSSPVVKSLMEVIDLDSSQFCENYDSDDEEENHEYFDQYTRENGTLYRNVMPCIFCRKCIPKTQFVSHFDFCLGFQQIVEYKKK